MHKNTKQDKVKKMWDRRKFKIGTVPLKAGQLESIVSVVVNTHKYNIQVYIAILSHTSRSRSISVVPVGSTPPSSTTPVAVAVPANRNSTPLSAGRENEGR